MKKLVHKPKNSMTTFFSEDADGAEKLVIVMTKWELQDGANQLSLSVALSPYTTNHCYNLQHAGSVDFQTGIIASLSLSLSLSLSSRCLQPAEDGGRLRI